MRVRYADLKKAILFAKNILEEATIVAEDELIIKGIDPARVAYIEAVVKPSEKSIEGWAATVDMALLKTVPEIITEDVEITKDNGAITFKNETEEAKISCYEYKPEEISIKNIEEAIENGTTAKVKLKDMINAIKKIRNTGTDNVKIEAKKDMLVMSNYGDNRIKASYKVKADVKGKDVTIYRVEYLASVLKDIKEKEIEIRYKTNRPIKITAKTDTLEMKAYVAPYIP